MLVAKKELGCKDRDDLSPSSKISARSLTELVSESALTGALSKDEITKNMAKFIISVAMKWNFISWKVHLGVIIPQG